MRAPWFFSSSFAVREISAGVEEGAAAVLDVLCTERQLFSCGNDARGFFRKGSLGLLDDGLLRVVGSLCCTDVFVVAGNNGMEVSPSKLSSGWLVH